ncbi:MAG: hypothetical protein IIZ35_05135, partial [Clostridia bacterium]|nr:hypothetical protein [Clostridia bacterium]
MNENVFFNAMAKIDGDLIDRIPREKAAPSGIAAPAAVAATASAAVLAAVLLSLAFSQKEPAARTVVEAASGSVSAPASEKAKDDEPTDPVPGAPVFTAEQIAELFKDTDMKSTNAYTTEYSPSS